MTVVYLDSVFALNALVDYLLLAAAARLADLPVRRGRWVLGALLGGVYAAAVFLPGLGWLSRWPAHLVSGCAMTAAAFGRRRLLRRFLLVGLVSCGFAGAVLALSLLTGGSIPSARGILYTNVSLRVLLLSAGAAYGVLFAVFRACAARGERGQLLEVTVALGRRRVRLRALLDTGNGLRDPMTGRQMLVADYRRLETLWPPEVRACLSVQALRAPDASLARLDALAGGGRFWLLPYSAVGVTGGMLLVFRSDWCQLGQRRCAGVPVALSPTELGSDFSALWGGEERRESLCKGG